MNLFYVPPELIKTPLLEVTGDELHHARKVLRLKINNTIDVTDGSGNCYVANIEQLLKDRLFCRVVNKTFIENPASGVYLALGIIKKRDRLEYALEKAVELGVEGILLFHGRHSEAVKINRNRCENIMISGMKQSLRFHKPDLKIFNSFTELLEHYRHCNIIVAHEKAPSPPGVIARPCVLCVGPEGGFAPIEIDTVLNYKSSVVSLGSYRLRSETAAVSILSYYWLMNA